MLNSLVFICTKILKTEIETLFSYCGISVEKNDAWCIICCLPGVKLLDFPVRLCTKTTKVYYFFQMLNKYVLKTEVFTVYSQH